MDDLMDALLGKLEKVSLVWSDTFAADPAIDVGGDKRLRRLTNEYGYDRVRECFEYAAENKLAPQGPSAMPLTVALLKAMGAVKEVAT
jgi:hypothetical protein